MPFFRSIRPIGAFGGPLADAPGGGKLINQYPYGAGGSASASGYFTLILQGAKGRQFIRVTRSTIAGVVPDGFSNGDNPPYLLPLGLSDGVVLGVITVRLPTDSGSGTPGSVSNGGGTGTNDGQPITGSGGVTGNAAANTPVNQGGNLGYDGGVQGASGLGYDGGVQGSTGLGNDGGLGYNGGISGAGGL